MSKNVSVSTCAWFDKKLVDVVSFFTNSVNVVLKSQFFYTRLTQNCHYKSWITALVFEGLRWTAGGVVVSQAVDQKWTDNCWGLSYKLLLLYPQVSSDKLKRVKNSGDEQIKDDEPFKTSLNIMIWDDLGLFLHSCLCVLSLRYHESQTGGVGWFLLLGGVEWQHSGGEAESRDGGEGGGRNSHQLAREVVVLGASTPG